jgi:hypothetical protein
LSLLPDKSLQVKKFYFVDVRTGAQWATVTDMFYFLKKFSTLLIRCIAWGVQLLLIAILLLGLPLSPLVVSLVSGKRQYLADYRRTVVRCAHMVPALWRAQVIERNLQRLLTPRSALPTQAIAGHCTHCGRCCVDRTCVFLSWTDDGQSRCSIHNKWFWKMTSCGIYPVDAHSIDTYACPSFKAIPITVVLSR